METQEELMGAYMKLRSAQAERTVAGPSSGGSVPKRKKQVVDDARSRALADAHSLSPTQVFNKYGKDTQLWVPDSDESGALAAASDPSQTPKGGSEPGGFFMFPPGHPDYVPLPPGEAALIAGRQHIHAEERLAPHWSTVVFRSPTGAEIRAQARHATYGTIAKVSGPLVNADPITAHTDLVNAAEITGCVAYIKRGGAPFTKKARVAVAAGACACVVANQDKETFGMSYTDDGLPFEALNIPCVMISVDIADKLECGTEWQVSLSPAKSDSVTKKSPSQAQELPHFPERPSTSTPAANGGGGGGSAELPRDGGSGLQPLPVDLKKNQTGGPLGKPGKKPTMWKKIKLLLP